MDKAIAFNIIVPRKSSEIKSVHKLHFLPAENFRSHFVDSP